MREERQNEKRRIAVLFGGCSSEHTVSLQSAYAVISHIDECRYEIVMIGITKEGCWYCYEGNPARIPADTWQDDERCYPASPCMDMKRHAFIIWKEGKTEYKKVDVALPILHGKNGEDGTVQGALALAGIPVLGCGVLASALCMDKERAHRLVGACGIKVPKSVTMTKEQYREEGAPLALAAPLGYPLFVKPLRAGSSFGITKVLDRKELSAAVERAFDYDDTVVLEEMIPGFEVGCAILEQRVVGEDGETKTKLLIGEVDEVELAEGFFDYEEKYTLKTSKIHVPARIDAACAERIKETAKRIYGCLSCSGFARVDLFFTPEGEIYFNEVNTIPGFTEHSRFPGMMKAAGISFSGLVDKLCALAEPCRGASEEKSGTNAVQEPHGVMCCGGTETFEGNLVLVNAKHALTEEIQMSDLEDCRRAADIAEKGSAPVLLKREAAEALKSLLEAVDKESEITVVSGYRSREEQKRIWDESLLENGMEFTGTYVAYPDHSEHQTGLAIDLAKRQENIDFIRPEFPDTGVFAEFRRRAAEFGFVERYPAGREKVTGIGAEPWHFRYVGCPHAKRMKERDMVLEEYVEFMNDERERKSDF